jgi:hypothetical protein
MAVQFEEGCSSIKYTAYGIFGNAELNSCRVFEALRPSVELMVKAGQPAQFALSCAGWSDVALMPMIFARETP